MRKPFGNTYGEIPRQLSPNYKGHPIWVGDLERSRNEENSFHPHTVFLEEPGVYQLIFSSKLPSAVKFQRWVFEDVLPSIRRTGTYTLPNKYNTIKFITNKVFATGDECELKEYHIFFGISVRPNERSRKGGDGKTWWSEIAGKYS